MSAGKRTKVTFYNVTMGTLRTGTKGNGYETFDKYTGYFQGLVIKEGEYQGKPTKQFQLRIKSEDTEELAVIQWTAKSWFTVSFFQRFGQINLANPFVIGVNGDSKNKDSKSSFCWMRQGNNKIVKDVSFPKPTYVDVDGEKIGQYKEVLAKADDMIEAANSFAVSNIQTSKSVDKHDVEEDGDEHPF